MTAGLRKFHLYHAQIGPNAPFLTMRERKMKHDHECCNVARRGFIGGGIVAGAALGVGAPAASAAALTQAQRDALTPQRVVELMLEGNARFVGGQGQRRDWRAEQQASAAGQYPAAIFLTCVDSRAPVEVICDLGVGDAFNARVAGNAVNDDILGSMEFACAAAGAKAVIVMGHTACGAIAGAIGGVVLGNLTLLLARFKGAVDATAYDGERTASNVAFVDAVAATNVRETVAQIRRRSPVLAGLEAEGRIVIVGAMYDLETAKVTLV